MQGHQTPRATRYESPQSLHAPAMLHSQGNDRGCNYKDLLSGTNGKAVQQPSVTIACCEGQLETFL